MNFKCRIGVGSYIALALLLMLQTSQAQTTDSSEFFLWFLYYQSYFKLYILSPSPVGTTWLDAVSAQSL